MELLIELLIELLKSHIKPNSTKIAKISQNMWPADLSCDFFGGLLVAMASSLRLAFSRFSSFYQVKYMKATN